MDEQRRIPFAWLLLFFFLLQLAVGFLVVDGSTLSFDESIWHYIGRNWFRNGLIPFSGGVDNKSPFMFIIFGISDLLFGINFWLPRLMGAVVQTIGIFFLFKLVEKRVGYKTALMAISIYGLSLAWKSTGGKYIAYTESYEVSLVIAAFYFFLRDDQKKSSFISGCVAGFSIFFRLTGIFGALTILIASIRKGKANCLAYLSGIAISSLLCIAIIALAGISLHDLFLFGFWDNFGEGSISGNSFLWKAESLFNGMFLSDIVLFLPGIVVYALIKKRIDVFLLWLLLQFIGLNLIGLYARQHFRDLLPPMCIITALSIHYLMERYPLHWRSAIIIIWISFFPKQIEPLIALRDLMRRGPEEPKPFCQDKDLQIYDEDKRALGEWVKKNTNVNDKVYIAGMSAVAQAYSERISPTIYFNATETATARERILKDLGAEKPALILVPKFKDYLRVDFSVRSFINAMVMKDYSYVTCQYDYAVYKRRE